MHGRRCFTHLASGLGYIWALNARARIRCLTGARINKEKKNTTLVWISQSLGLGSLYLTNPADPCFIAYWVRAAAAGMVEEWAARHYWHASGKVIAGV